MEASLEPVLGRKTKYKHISGSVRLELSWSHLVSSPQPPSTSSTQAVLSLFIYSAHNLCEYTDRVGAVVPLAVGYLPSPRVSVSLTSARVQQSKICRDSQQPEFKEGFIFELGQNWKSQSLKIQIDDSKKRKIWNIRII